MHLQIPFFPHNLAVEQPNRCEHVNQKYPIREDQELAKQDESKGNINGIAAVSKNAAGY
jgi:hypothetical protein